LTLGIGPVLETIPAKDAVTAAVASEDSIPLVTSLDEVLSVAPPTVIPPRPTKLRHRPGPRQGLTQIAVRYGVTREDLLRWNPKVDPQASFPKRRRRLEVRARRLPPPRQQIRYVVQEGENWIDISAKFRIGHRDLHAYNWRVHTIEPGQELKMWIDPGWPQTIHPGAGPELPESFELPQGGLSKGRPNRGRLEEGVLLPLSELYSRKARTSGLWGSSHTILQIHRAFANFRHDTGFEGDVIIGAISRRRGGRFVPHISHQSGRDIDIRLPLWPGLSGVGSHLADEIDWYATWGLVKAFIETGEVATIFLDVSRHRHLYEAARAMGETAETLEPVIKWPRWSGKSRPVVRHSSGHDTHIHVRIKCGSAEPRCKTR